MAGAACVICLLHMGHCMKAKVMRLPCHPPESLVMTQCSWKKWPQLHTAGRDGSEATITKPHRHTAPELHHRCGSQRVRPADVAVLVSVDAVGGTGAVLVQARRAAGGQRVISRHAVARVATRVVHVPACGCQALLAVFCMDGIRTEMYRTIIDEELEPTSSACLRYVRAAWCQIVAEAAFLGLRSLRCLLDKQPVIYTCKLYLIITSSQVKPR
jgi:hypothetical protein